MDRTCRVVRSPEPLTVCVGVLALLAGCGGSGLPDRIPAPERPSARVEQPVKAPQAAIPPWLGRVVGPDERPVAGASVRFERETACWPAPRYEALDTRRTDRGGRFDLPLPEDLHDLVLVVEAPGLARYAEPVWDPELSSRYRRTVRLERGFVLSGVVRAPGGARVPGCDVYLQPGWLELRPGRVVRTDELGVFRFEDVRAGVVQLVARHTQWPAARRAVTVASASRADGVVLRFDQGQPRRVRGRVTQVESNRRPIEAATVEAYPTAPNGRFCAPMVAVTEPDGSFSFGGLDREDLELRVSHPAFSTVTRYVRLRDRGASDLTVREVQIELQPRSRVRGWLEGDMGSDWPAEPLVLLLRTRSGEVRYAEVGADRAFDFGEPVSSGVAVIEIEDGRRAFVEEESRWWQIEVGDGEETVLVAELTAPSVVTGRVSSEGPSGSSAGVGGAVVSAPAVRPRFDDEARIGVITDANGRFRLCGLRPGSVQLQVAAEGFATRSVAANAPGPGQRFECPLVEVKRPGRIIGRVLRGTVPLEGVIVWTGTSIDVRTVATGNSGRFRLRGLAPGRYRVKARFSTLPIVKSEELVIVRSGEDTYVGDLAFERGRPVAGRVVDQRDTAVAGAVLVVEGGDQAALSDPDGRFELEVPRGVSRLTVRSPDGRVERIVRLNEVDLERIELRLPKRGALLVRVVQLPAGKPAFETSTGALVRYESGGDLIRRWIRGNGDRLLIDEVPVGVTSLSMHVPGCAPALLEGVRILPGSRAEYPGSAELEPGASIDGRVVDNGGSPVAGALVHLGTERDLYVAGYTPSVRTNAEGWFHVAGVSPSAARLTVAALGMSTREFVLRLPDDLLKRRTFVLEPASQDPSGCCSAAFGGRSEGSRRLAECSVAEGARCRRREGA